MARMALRRFARRAAHITETVGVYAVLFIMVLTVIDVIGAKVFVRPVRGSTELVGFAQLVAIAGGMAMACFAGRHVALEFVVERLPQGVQRVVQGFVAVLGLLLFGLLSWQSYLYGKVLAASGQIASTARIPFYPFAYALAVLSAVTALFFAADLGRALAGERQEP